jgi:hypothetical protein
MTGRPHYAPAWLPRIVTDYTNRIGIKIRYHAGDFGIRPPASQSLAASLRPFKEAAKSPGRLPTSRQAVPVAFQMAAGGWRDVLDCAVAVGVSADELVRAAIAERIRQWLQMDAAQSATRQRKPRPGAIVPFHHRPWLSLAQIREERGEV